MSSNLSVRGALLLPQTQRRYFSFSGREPWGSRWRVWDDIPSPHGNEYAWKPFNDEQQSPAVNRSMVAKFDNSKCQSAGKTAGQRCCRDEQSSPECELIPLVEERQIEGYSWAKRSFGDSKQYPQDQDRSKPCANALQRGKTAPSEDTNRDICMGWKNFVPKPIKLVL